jgi:hypothetical protein
MKTEKLGTCVSLYSDFFDASLFLEHLELETQNDWSGISWKNSAIGQGSVMNYRTSIECDVSILGEESNNTPISQLFKRDIQTPMLDIVDDYKKEYNVFISKNEGWRVLKYNIGGEYHNHYDHAPINSRVVSLVAFLNDVEEGGELEFSFFDIKIKPKKNTVVVFPSNFPYLHIAHPVEKGRKYSLVTWFQ